MSRLEQGGAFPPSPEAVDNVRVTLQQLGFRVTEADARRLAEAVLAVEGPRLKRVVRGTFENSLEIIRDTADAALGDLREKRVERPDLVGGGRRPMAERPPVAPPPEELEDDEPRPVFKRPRR
jgi:hypothetical protein